MLTAEKEVRREETRTLFEKAAVEVLGKTIEDAKKGKDISLINLVRYLKSLFAESVSEEFGKLVAEKVNVTTKRKLYGAPGKSLQLFTIVESRNKPQGYYISFGLSKELPKETELKFLLSTLNLLALEAYKNWNFRQLCIGGEKDGSVKRA